MQIHELKPTHRLKKKKRVGRGGKRGTYSGKGCKGQKSRAGAKIKPMEREFILRIPKRRGLGFSRPRRAGSFVAVPLTLVEKRFVDGEVVSPKTLIEKGLVWRKGGKIPRIKILASAGAFSKRLTIEACVVSKDARGAVESAGGKVKS